MTASPSASLKPRIGLALSGGGVRAAAFHLGVLRFLADQKQLENVTHLSSVSGGSLLLGLVYHHAGYCWPDSDQFVQKVYPAIKRTLTKQNLQFVAIWRLLSRPQNWPKIIHRANILGDTIHDYWGVTGKLVQIPSHPIWSINGTTSETGKRWRFKDGTMGDYLIGYADDVDFRLADVMAISAAFPGGIGPYRLKTADYKWYKFDSWKADAVKIPIEPSFEKLFISDGGLYDNLGLEPFYDASKRIFKTKNGVDYLIVSDASSPLTLQQRGFFWQVLRRTKRLIDIIYDQVRLLRIRGIVPYFFEHHGSGIYLQLGMTPHAIHLDAEKAGASIPKELRGGRYFSEEEICKATNYPTNLSKLNADNFMMIERHGYETAENHYCIFPPHNSCL